MSKARELSKLPNYVLSTVAELKLSVGKEQGDKAFVGGYYADGDQGGGDFYWDAISVEADNGGTIFQVTGTTTGRWKRIYSGADSAKWFGHSNKNIVDYVTNKTPVHILCYGDSITWGKTPSGTQSSDRYPITLLNMLEQSFDYSSVTVTEKGFPGRQTDTALANFDADVVAFNPDFVLIMFGINDSRDYDGGAYDVVPVSEYKYNLRDMCFKAFKNGITPILLTPTPTIEKAEQIELLSYYNACIDVANEIGVKYIDTRKAFHSFLKLSLLNIEEIMDDYIHMTRYDWLGVSVFENIINSNITISSNTKVNTFDRLYVRGDNLTFSQVTGGRNCAVLNKNGTTGTYIKFLFFTVEPKLSMLIHTADANNTLHSYSVIIDGVTYNMSGKQGVIDLSFKDLVAIDINAGVHTLEINISSFTSANATDVLALYGIECQVLKNPKLVVMQDIAKTYAIKKAVVYDTVGSGKFYFEADLATGQGTSAIEFLIDDKEVLLNSQLNTL